MIVNSQKVFDVMAAHNADTAEFLNDFNRVADELAKRSGDLVAAAQSLNSALPNLVDHAGQLNTLLAQTGRLSDDLADIVRSNQAFIDKSFNGGQAVLDTLYDHRGDVIPLVVGLRQYVETLTELIRIPVGDGTYMAAVRGLTAGQACDVFSCPGTNNPNAAAAPAPPPPPPAPPPPDQSQQGLLPPLPLPVPIPTLPQTPTIPGVSPPTPPTTTGIPGILNFISGFA